MMTLDEITKLIDGGETLRVEYKSEQEKNVDFAKQITAFANGTGGYLLIGVEDDGTISGVKNPVKLEERIYNICSDSTRPVVTPEAWKYEIERKYILCFYVSPRLFQTLCYIATRPGTLLYTPGNANSRGQPR